MNIFRNIVCYFLGIFFILFISQSVSAYTSKVVIKDKYEKENIEHEVVRNCDGDSPEKTVSSELSKKKL